MTADNTVLLARDGPIATLTLNRPDALNVLDHAMVDALIAHTTGLASDASTRVVVLRGAGRHFMAGGDIRAFGQSLAEPADQRVASFRRLLEGVHAAVETLIRMPQPIVAGVQGAVAGFGLSLANAADLVLAADDAYFASAYLQIAVTPDGGGTWTLPRIVGARRAAEIMMLGERFDANEARALGVVNRVVPASELDATVAAVAARIAAAPALAMQRLKRLLRESSNRTLSEQLAAEAASFSACTGTDDFVEGITAFLDKRKPEFNRRR